MFTIVGTVLGTFFRWIVGRLSGSTRRDEIALGREQQIDADQKATIKAQDTMLRDNSRPPTRSETEKSLDDGTF